MRLVEIEAQLQHLTPDELRQLALKSWTAFAEREGQSNVSSECDEDDPALLAAMDEAIERAEAAPNESSSGEENYSRVSHEDGCSPPNRRAVSEPWQLVFDEVSGSR